MADADLKDPIPQEVLDTILNYRPTIRAFLRNKGIPDRDLDDVVQDVVFVAWSNIDPTKLSQVVPLDEAVERFLVGIAWRVASTYLNTMRNQEVLASGRIEPMVPDASEEAERREELAHIQDHVWPPHTRDVMVLATMGFTAPEIAEELGIPINTVYSRLRRGQLAAKAERKKIGPV